MTLLIALYPAMFSQEYSSRIKSVFYDFVKRPTIPAVNLKLYACKNMFDSINIVGALKNERLKNNRPIIVPLPSSYSAKIHWKGCDKYFLNFSGWCVVALGR